MIGASMSRLLRHVLLALMLAFAQQAGIAHLTAHATQQLGTATGQHDAPATTEDGTARCAQCVLYASLGASPVPAVATPDFIPPRPLQVPDLQARTIQVRAPAAYRSRAPPLQA
jgi:hypothetical protein